MESDNKCVQGRQIMTLAERRLHFRYCTHPQCAHLKVLYYRCAEYVKANEKPKERGK